GVRMIRRAIAALGLAFALPAATFAGQTPATVAFAKDMLPLLKQRCVGCHGPEQQMSAFRLDRRSSALRGGRDPNDIVPGSSATSHLYLRLVGSAPAPSMPPAGRLADEEIAVFKAWLDQGADWPDEWDEGRIV